MNQMWILWNSKDFSDINLQRKIKELYEEIDTNIISSQQVLLFKLIDITSQAWDAIMAVFRFSYVDAWQTTLIVYQNEPLKQAIRSTTLSASILNEH
jgi:hypothetical protein